MADESPMQFPPDYLQVVGRGATVLRALGARLRDIATKRPEAPELWLSVRDLEGLSGRLAESTDWEWRHGFADLLISPQDLAVMDELLALRRVGPVELSAEDNATLTSLYEFLRQYCGGERGLDEPAV
jgi:hypothetical protein